MVAAADAVNEQAAQLCRWLLGGHGALRNVAALLVDSFGPTGAVAATIGRTSLTAYPAETDPPAQPGQRWIAEQDTWVHPLHSALLPASSSAEHHVIAGVTARNDILVINLAAVGYLGIEDGDGEAIMRSWLLQLLAKTPTAHLAVTDATLSIAGAPRLSHAPGVLPLPDDVTVLFSTGSTDAPRHRDAPTVVSTRAYDAPDVVLCDDKVAGVYLSRWYWPLWRRMEVAEPRWVALTATLDAGAQPSPTVLGAVAGDTGRPELGGDGRRPGMYVFGEAHLLAADDADAPGARRPLATAAGVDDTVAAVLVLADAGSTAGWDTTDARRAELVTAIRRLLGRAALRDDGGAHLVADFYCDWRDFDSLIGRDPAQAADDDLAAALRLLRGPPFDGLSTDAGQTVQLLRGELLQRCGDAALELASRQRAAGDDGAAYRSARVGLVVDPLHEELWELAADTADRADRALLAGELARALPNPTAPPLQQLLAEASPPR